MYQVLHRDSSLVLFHLIQFCLVEFSLQFLLVLNCSTIFGLYHIIHKIQQQLSRLSDYYYHVTSVNAAWEKEVTCTFFSSNFSPLMLGEVLEVQGHFFHNIFFGVTSLQQVKYIGDLILLLMPLFLQEIISRCCEIVLQTSFC